MSAPRLRRRSCPSWGGSQRRGVTGAGGLGEGVAAALEGAAEGDLVGVFEVAAYWQS